MNDRAAGLTAKINKRLDKNRVVAERRKKRLEETNPAQALNLEWVAAIRDSGLKTVPAWTKAEYSLAKKLVNEVGFDRAVDLVRYFVKTWEKRKTSTQRRRGDLPAMKLCWSLRGRLFAELDGCVSRPKSKREKLMRGEYNEAGADASPSRGWGD